ncbi:Rhodanese-like protein [Cyberlindnera jadinii NRRL Y-1542]|uniref:Rhodanese-like protein n=2 Tax=Cyberlindnera jadinii (strain ATCC 18201 / CBS 1600 / BCRC 20928 / JCM 3617 / NBRC 0987 / NRRL Y-1542) TaxID=983966 RepID=A0A1E4RVR8_CYBJN|nr:Rhodanese-like protein [Cyberlindnera jadinii NRRL Y-1542]ODV71374.1 Rhodanese-like protein [Cyberlindnera jadinii NRRL Y-1542]
MSYSITSIKYIEPEVLKSWFTSGSSTGNGSFKVVDVRDSDHVGGHIRGSLHFPTSSLASDMDALIEQVKNADDIVFHCALSQQRGPSAAMRFLRSVEQGFLDDKNVWVLRGGFTEWQRLYGEDTNVTEGYQKDIWQYGY